MSILPMRYLIAVILLLSVFSSSVFAQEGASSAGDVTQEQPSTYTLPYPGMLPDNPLYSLKMLRDRIVLFLIADPVKRAEFNLLQADKRLQAGVYLWREEPEKTELAISTISKGENYFEQAIGDTRQAIAEGKVTDQIQGDLEQAAKKHTEVLQQVYKEIPSEFRPDVQTLLDRTQQFELSVKSLN